MRLFFTFWCVFALFIHTQEIECEGFGITREEATRDALRNAVEQGAGTKIFSETVVQDFVALKDVLITESFGFVTKYSVISQKTLTTGEWQVKIQATVEKGIDKKWAEIKILLQQKGFPKIMFYIQEFLDNQKISSYGENILIQKFKNMGFTVIDKDQTLKKHKHIEQLYETNNTEELVKILAGEGAQLLITGQWHGNFTKEIVGPGDLNYIVHSYSLQSKIYRTDSFQVVAAENQSFTSNSEAMIYNRETAGKDGFVRAINEGYLQALVVDLLQAWISENQEGENLQLEVSNVSYMQGKSILQILKEIPEIQSIEIDRYQNRIMYISLKSLWKISLLAEKLEQISGLPLEVFDLSRNILKVRYLVNDSD